MKRIGAASLAMALAAQQAGSVYAAPPSAKTPPMASVSIAIPQTTFKLDNGLTVVVHEDHSAPLVAVAVWYHVGSKDEPKGRSGFAHLFEHLMFNGSEHFNDDWFKATQKLGATDLNGTTNADRTNYFETVPRSSLDAVLWLESDRMGHLLGAIDQAKLDEQRAVVKNERRQNYENRPFGKAAGLITAATFPQGHPYDHLTIGSMEDLNAATLDDVKAWFRRWYGPSNAVLVLSGDISVADARAKAQTYFGDIPPGEPVEHAKSWIVPLAQPIREVAYDRVAQARTYKIWNVADISSPDMDYLQLAADVLGSGRNSRLYKRLVTDEKLVSRVSASLDAQEIAGQFMITADARPGASVDRIEAIIAEEVQRLLTSGMTAAELARVRTQQVASYVRYSESISFKASLLAESQTYHDDPDAWRASFERLRDASASDVQGAAARWLAKPAYALRVLPFGNPTASPTGADRSAVPIPEAAIPAQFPAVEQATLSNGARLLVVRKAAIPVVNISLVLPTGYAADYATENPTAGRLAMQLLNAGTRTRSADAIADTLDSLGATLAASGGGEISSVDLSALRTGLEPALEIFADVVRTPTFPQAEFERAKADAHASLAATRLDGGRTGARLLPSLAYGPDSPYGRLTTDAGIDALTRADLERFHDRWFAPNNATLIVTGDTSLAEIRPMLEQALSGWKGAPSPATVTASATAPAKPVIYLVDRPGAAQSSVQAAFPTPPRLEGDEIARRAFNTVFGGDFASRINLKLREEKGWTYGARSGISGGHGTRLFTASSSVQTDRTADSMHEMALLFDAVQGTSPVSEEELRKARDSALLKLADAWSTADGLGSSLADTVIAGLPVDYYAHYPEKLAALKLPEVRKAAGEIIAGKHPVWLVVGDRARIEKAIRALGIGEVRVIDADGHPVP